MLPSGPGDALIEELAYTLNGVGDILGINHNEYGYDGFGRLVEAMRGISARKASRKRRRHAKRKSGCHE